MDAAIHTDTEVDAEVVIGKLTEPMRLKAISVDTALGAGVLAQMGKRMVIIEVDDALAEMWAQKVYLIEPSELPLLRAAVDEACRVVRAEMIAELERDFRDGVDDAGDDAGDDGVADSESTDDSNE